MFSGKCPNFSIIKRWLCLIDEIWHQITQNLLWNSIPNHIDQYIIYPHKPM